LVLGVVGNLEGGTGRAANRSLHRRTAAPPYHRLRLLRGAEL
jgi:hypothetical protein